MIPMAAQPLPEVTLICGLNSTRPILAKHGNKRSHGTRTKTRIEQYAPSILATLAIPRVQSSLSLARFDSETKQSANETNATMLFRKFFFHFPFLKPRAPPCCDTS